MGWDLDKEEFYETFSELQESEGSQRALEWAWSALDWTQQELRKEATKSQSILAEERAAVVAWLRRKATDDFCALRVKEACDAEQSADVIERGDHRREE